MEPSSSSSPVRSEVQSPVTVSSSSAMKPPHASESLEMEVDSEGIINLTSEVEIIEDISTEKEGKRKVPAESTPISRKKAKADQPTIENSIKKQTEAQANKKGEKEVALVDLKGKNLVLNQAPASCAKLMSTLRSTLTFTEFFITWLSTAAEDAVFEEWPQELWTVIARLVHESDKTLPVLLKQVKAAVIEYIKVASPSDEESQEQTNIWDKRVSQTAIKAIIEQIAQRNNYGLDLTDIPDNADTDATEIPLSLQIQRWEVQDTSLLPAEMQAKFAKRLEDRIEAKDLAKILFIALSPEEQIDILSKPSGKRGRKSAGNDDDFAPVASGSGSTSVKKEKGVKAPKAPKVKKELTTEQLAALEEKERIKAEKEATKAEKEAAKKENQLKKEAADAERKEKKAHVDEKKAKKAAEDAEKKAVKAAVEAEKKAKQEKADKSLKKQSNSLFAFLEKSPAPVDARRDSRSPHRAGQSDFAATFRPPQERANVKIAPLNRFVKLNAKKNTLPFKINDLPSLSREDGLSQLKVQLKSYEKQFPPPPHKPVHPLSVKAIVQKVTDSTILGTDPGTALVDLNDRKKVQIKHLQFATDTRPGYVGTFTKISKVVTGRRPFGRETALLNYDIDSEEEWEESGPPGDDEEVGSGGERSGEEDSDALSDDWMCDDDEVDFAEGHVAEGSVEPDVDPELAVIGGELEMAARKVAERERKNKAIKESQKKRKAGPFLPVVRGPAWEKKVGIVAEEAFKGMGIRFLNDATYGLNPITFISKSFPPAAAKVSKAPLVPTIASTSKSGSTKLPKVKSATDSEKVSKPKSTKTLPASLLPRLIAIIHGSTLSKPLLREALWAVIEKEAGVTKGALDNSFKETNAKSTKGLWSVPDDIRARYDSTDDSTAIEVDK